MERRVSGMIQPWSSGSLLLSTLLLGCSEPQPNPADDSTTSFESDTEAGPGSEGEATETSSDTGELATCECEGEELCIGRFAPGFECGPDVENCDACADPVTLVLGCEPRPSGCTADMDPCDPACSIPICGSATCSNECPDYVDTDLWCSHDSCELQFQDCPADERCLPYKLLDEVDAPYVGKTCHPTPAGAAVGEPCTTESLTEPGDDCGVGAICWDLEGDVGAYAGVCHELCSFDGCDAGTCVRVDPWAFMFVCEPSCSGGEPCVDGETCTDAIDQAGEPTSVCLPA